MSMIRIVDSLAEITRYKDRELLERSLLSTLSELFVSEEFRLYNVLVNQDSLQLALVLYANHGAVVPGPYPRKHDVPPLLLRLISKAIANKGLVDHYNQGDRQKCTVVYPVFDKGEHICGILVHIAEKPSVESQRLIYGLLRIYSNYVSLLEESHRDKLTNLLNRENLDPAITKHILRYSQMQHNRRKGRRNEDAWHAWLCIIDVDFFKRINDEWGHLYGDEVLILFARLLESIFREEDQLFRYGGEEFIVLFKTLTLDDARMISERTRRAVEKHQFPGIGYITASLGITEISDQAGASHVIDQADRALYYAKDHGRNQVFFYHDLIERGLLEDHSHEQQGSVDFF